MVAIPKLEEITKLSHGDRVALVSGRAIRSFALYRSHCPSVTDQQSATLSSAIEVIKQYAANPDVAQAVPSNLLTSVGHLGRGLNGRAYCTSVIYHVLGLCDGRMISDDLVLKILDCAERSDIQE